MNGVRKKLLPKKSNHCSNTLSHGGVILDSGVYR